MVAVTPAAVSVTGFLLLLAVGILLEARARTGDQRGVRAVPSVAAAMRTSAGRAAVFMWWLWLGVHFLAR